MRLWTVHPRYLDARGLVALWREALLAQAVLRGRTIGYVHHPQLARFRSQASPLGAVGDYLRVIHAEAARRGYRFAAGKVSRARSAELITVTRGQLDHDSCAPKVSAPSAACEALHERRVQRDAAVDVTIGTGIGAVVLAGIAAGFALGLERRAPKPAVAVTVTAAGGGIVVSGVW